MSTILEQIAAFETKRASLVAANEAIMAKAAEDGATLDAEQEEAFDSNSADVEAIDSHLKRLRTMEKAQKENLVEAKGGNSKEGTQTRVHAQIKTEKKAAPGVQFARLARVKALAKLDGESVRVKAKELYGESSDVYGLLTKAAVPAATTTNQPWLGHLVSESSVLGDFVEFLRPMTILGQFGQNGIPSLRSVPFRVSLVGQTTGGEGYWVGEGKAKPLTQWQGSRTTLEPTKVANIAVATEELLRDSSPSAELLIRDELANALRERLDRDFINPAKAAVAGVSPASVLNGVTAIPSTGTTADNVRQDIRALFGAFIAANNAPETGVFVMNAVNALALSLMQNPLGATEFPEIGMTGGTFFGHRVIVSQYVPAGTVALINAQDIYLADEGGIAVDMSREASLEMDNAPTHNSDTPTPAELVSMFQTNSVAFRAERTISWARRRPVSVAHLSGVAWGTPSEG